MPGSDSDNPIERLLASLATPAEEGAGKAGDAAGGEEAYTVIPADGASKPSAATFFYGEDAAGADELAERRRRAEWTLEGGLGRSALTSLLFTFAMFAAAKTEWDRYPEDDEALAAQPWAKVEEDAEPPL